MPHFEAFLCDTNVIHDRVAVGGWGSFQVTKPTPEVRAEAIALRLDLQREGKASLGGACGGQHVRRVLGDAMAMDGAGLRAADGSGRGRPGVRLAYDGLAVLQRLTATGLEGMGRRQRRGICDNRLKVLEDIIRMTQRRGIKYKTICKDVIELRGPAQVRRPLSDDPLYVEFLEKVAKLPDSAMQDIAKNCIEELRGQPERLRGIAESKKQYEERRKAEAQNPTPPKPKPPIANPDVVFHALTLQVSPPNIQEKAAVGTRSTGSVERDLDVLARD